MTDSEQYVRDVEWERIAREEVLPRITDELVREHEESPLGPHSHDLHLVETFLRRQKPEHRGLLVVTEPREEWAIAELSGVRGRPPEILDDYRFETQEAADHALFLKRIRELERRVGDQQERDDE